MKGYKIGQVIPKEYKEKFKDKLMFAPGDLVIAVKTPPGIHNEDLTNSVFIVKYVCLELDESDGLEPNEPQPDNLPYYYCTNISWDEIIFSNDELKPLNVAQQINLLKAGLLNRGNIPARWEDKFYVMR